MFLNRLGNKKSLAKDILPYFPPHDFYIEPFFGAGGMFFCKPKAKNNILNDLDSDVYNLFQVVMDQKEAFLEAFKCMPVHDELLQYWRKNKETDPIKKALRFILLSNYTFMGKGETLKLFESFQTKKIINFIGATHDMLLGCQFTNRCFKKLMKSIPVVHSPISKMFIYCDPPYVSTTSNYSNNFKPQDAIDLLDILCQFGAKFAYSEFDNEFIMQEAEKRKLYVKKIKERRSLDGRNTEILITNYAPSKNLFACS